MTTSQAQVEAVRRYEAANYKKIMLQLNIHEDGDIIASMDEAKEMGIPRRQWMRALFDGDTPSGDLVEKDKVEKLLWEHRIPPQAIKAIMDALK